MRFVIVAWFLSILGLCCHAKGQNTDTTLEEVLVPPTIKTDGSQSFRFRFKTSNNIEREENGFESADPKVGLVVRGRYSYVRPDGKREIVTYIADKNGFRIVPNVRKGGLSVKGKIAPAALASLAG